ncbi:hypothetical protein QOZ98_001424 [Planomicrobium stackebrandtii]|uniref:SEC-C domain-containing protein n=1 Tax=Planomicrobium stackebrandtii TaxID=253160 RepID=A0ABU0GTA7_9BACL|nr:SEC-C metal-binding domain-containing protein [Planomicrobium stackebrandtii]MDQ0428598.1 hypothetical protein [Planomicrobium stackebrandtii]
MVGRNDPCPCGSGKKYKKCCGKEQVVDLQEVISSELERIMEGFVEEGVEPADYFELEQRIRKWEHALLNTFDEDLLELAAFESYLFIDRADAWKNYLARQKKLQKRQRILDVLKSWEQPFILLGEIQALKNEQLIVRDTVTNEQYLFPNNGEAKPGEWVFGIVMRNPAQDKSELQPTSSIIFIPKHQEAVARELKFKLKSGVSDSLELYKTFAEKSEKSSLPEFEARVLGQVERFTKEFGLNDTLLGNLAFAFLLEVPLTARKPEGVAAGILQAINDLGLFGNFYVTQKNLAAYFEISVASLSKYRVLAEDYLVNKIQSLAATLEGPNLDLDIVMNTPQILISMGTDPRITERGMWQMFMRTSHSKAESLEELERMTRDTMNDAYMPVNDAEAAQLTSYQAYDCRNEKERQQLAKQAFKLDPENTDANLLMAEITLAPTKRRLHYLQAIESGYKNFDQEVDPDSAWGYVLNRPLLRALFSYGAWLMAQKEYAAAIEPLEKLMELNSYDQQGTRWLLASAYIRAGEWDKTEDFMVEFPPNDYEALDFYFDSIMDMHDGTLNTSELKELKSDALEWNHHIPPLIRKGKDPGEFPRSLSLESGNEDEAKLIYWLIFGMPGIEKFS